jgi:hypothetical protein
MAPVVATQTSPFLAEAATVLGNSPGISTGGPTRLISVGPWGEILSMDKVLQPALTANIFYTMLGAVTAWGELATHVTDHGQRRLAQQWVWKCWFFGRSIDSACPSASSTCRRPARECAISGNRYCSNRIRVLVGEEIDSSSCFARSRTRFSCAGEQDEGGLQRV